MSRAVAFGKVILLGEHVCVYGAPAIAVALDRGARAEAKAADGAATLHLGGAFVRADASSEDPLGRAFAALLAVAPSQQGVAIEATSDMLPGGGLGSSAALGVAIGRAVSALRTGATPDEGEAIARAAAWESVFHGNPSGIDVAVAATGGCLRFERDVGGRPLALGRDLWLAVGSTGAGASTREMVEGVASLRLKKPDIVNRAVEGVRALVENAALAIEAGDLAGLGRLMDLNQMLLAGLMVSTEALEALCATARKAGALGAKLTGAGGGGSVVALVPSSRVGAASSEEESQRAADGILDAWRAEGFDGFLTRVRAADESSAR